MDSEESIIIKVAKKKRLVVKKRQLEEAIQVKDPIIQVEEALKIEKALKIEDPVIEDPVKIEDPVIEDPVIRYIANLSEIEKQVLEIARKNLESSFCIEKSIGFLEFLKNKK